MDKTGFTTYLFGSVPSTTMTPGSTPLAVHHNTAAHRFEVEIEGQSAFAAYERDGDRLIFTHTEVPPAFRGGGVAGQIVRAALEFAAREGLRVEPQCSYVEAFILRHPEFQPLVDRAT